MAEGFNVRLDAYQGPFDVLLSLLSQRELELTQISLSQVTEEFIAYVKNLDMISDADQVSSFIDVASILVEAKSASLIPHDEEDSDFESSLEALQERDLLFARLLQYRAFKQAGEDFRQRIAANSGRFAHPGTMSTSLSTILPQLAWSMPLDDFAKLAATVIENAPASEVSINQLHIPLIDLRVQAGIVRDRLRAAGNKTDVTFAQIIEDAKATIEIVARFLALLAFFKQGVVQFKQDEPFDDLHVRWLMAQDSPEAVDVVAISEGDFA